MDRAASLPNKKGPPFLGRRPFGVAATSNSRPSGAQGRKIVKFLSSTSPLPLHRQRADGQRHLSFELLAGNEFLILFHGLRGWIHDFLSLSSNWACPARTTYIAIGTPNGFPGRSTQMKAFKGSLPHPRVGPGLPNALNFAGPVDLFNDSFRNRLLSPRLPRFCFLCVQMRRGLI